MTTIVLFGGPSDERHVSVASAQNVARTLDAPLLWFWAPDGPVYDVAASDLLAHQRPFEVDFLPSRPAVWPDIEMALDTLPVEDPVFLLALHGTAGEDGELQRMLEKRRLPFTGSGSAASATAFDKERAKAAVRGVVKLAESRPFSGAADLEEMLARHPRVVLKPRAGGSSRGLFFVNRGDDFDVKQLTNVPYMIEEFLEGREITVGVIDRGDGPMALPCIEIEVDPGFAFDYNGKYLGSGTREICPANIPPERAAEAQREAVAAHRALGCDGYSRSDFVMRDNGCWFLELNTLPGLTAASLVPQQLKTAGIEFKTFLEEQLALARQRSLSP